MPGHARIATTLFWKFNWWGSSPNASFYVLSKLNSNTFPIANSSLAFKWMQIFHALLRMPLWVGKTKQILLMNEPSATGARLKCRGPRHLEEVCFRRRRWEMWCPEASVALREIHASLLGAWLLAHVPWGAPRALRVPTGEAVLPSTGSVQWDL